MKALILKHPSIYFLLPGTLIQFNLNLTIGNGFKITDSGGNDITNNQIVSLTILLTHLKML